MIVYAKHEPYWSTGHLGKVIKEMRSKGAPHIRVVPFDGDFYAIEGSHRLAAADYLGLTPTFEVLTPELGDETNQFWRTVKADLPKYQFRR